MEALGGGGGDLTPSFSATDRRYFIIIFPASDNRRNENTTENCIMEVCLRSESFQGFQNNVCGTNRVGEKRIPSRL